MEISNMITFDFWEKTTLKKSSYLELVYETIHIHTVPTRSLETPERSLSRKLIFVVFPKIHFFTGDNQIFFGSSHNGWLLPEFFSDFYI
jgi:hypothetical protein